MKLFGFCETFAVGSLSLQGRYDMGNHTPCCVCFLSKYPYQSLLSHTLGYIRGLMRINPELVRPSIVDELYAVVAPLQQGAVLVISGQHLQAPLLLGNWVADVR